MKIIVTKRSNDWHACIEGEPEYWGCGRSISEAIGSLIDESQQDLAHYEKTGIVIVTTIAGQQGREAGAGSCGGDTRCVPRKVSAV